MRISASQVVTSFAGAGCGAALGLFCWSVFDYGVGWSAFVGALGSFVGFALTLPGVSAWRVLGGFAWAIVSYNTCESWGAGAYEWVAGEDAETGGSPPPDVEQT